MGLMEKVVEMLKKVQDPEVNQDVYSLQLVYDIEVNDNEGIVTLKFRPTVPNCPIGIQLAVGIKQALLSLEEVKRVNLTVTDFYMAYSANKYLEMMDKEQESS
ncbi:MAG: DUF59 domain-containing protein [Spirochaetales bacterium]|nr:DUF59 domain-containing protein [Spirochaetales bacterium]